MGRRRKKAPAAVVGFDVGKSFHWAFGVGAGGEAVLSERVDNRPASRQGARALLWFALPRCLPAFGVKGEGGRDRRRGTIELHTFARISLFLHVVVRLAVDADSLLQGEGSPEGFPSFLI